MGTLALMTQISKEFILGRSLIQNAAWLAKKTKLDEKKFNLTKTTQLDETKTQLDQKYLI